MSTLFPSSREVRHAAPGAEIFARVMGSGPPLLLLHGFPQTHAMWHRLAPELAQRFTLVMPDLRGYGFSSCPENDAENRAYSKRVMAEDMVSLMQSLGHRRFAVVGHDRGGRVAYRLALDHPEIVRALTVIDIVPTFDMWSGMERKLAMTVYHWLFLAQPHPLPEMLIERAPIAFLDYTLASWTARKSLAAFEPDALAEYRLHYATPEHIHATCDDYRAGATIDFAIDAADRENGVRIACPTLVLSGSGGIPASHAQTVETTDPAGVWRKWCENVTGHSIPGGHFLPEENPEATLQALVPFLAAHAA